jgi:hypothetical protein
MVISKMNVDKIVYMCFRELALWQIRLWAQGEWTNLPEEMMSDFDEITLYSIVRRI